MALLLHNAVDVAVVRLQGTRRERPLEAPNQLLRPELIDDVLLLRIEPQVLRCIQLCLECIVPNLSRKVEDRDDVPPAEAAFHRHVPHMRRLAREQVHRVGHIHGRRADALHQLDPVVGIGNVECLGDEERASGDGVKYGGDFGLSVAVELAVRQAELVDVEAVAIVPEDAAVVEGAIGGAENRFGEEAGELGLRQRRYAGLVSASSEMRQISTIP